VVLSHRVPNCAMTDEPLQNDELPQKKKTQLALAIAQGVSVATWARGNEVPKRTAYRWASEPAVRATVESCRRRALDRAVGRMARRATWAVDQIVDLGANARSETVKLKALRAVMSDMMKVSEFSVLELRMTDIEEKLRGRIGNARRPR
jgi:hypothetical protein